MDLATWLDHALADAERRRLDGIRPVLEGLARTAAVLRLADWNTDASGHASPGATARQAR